MMRYPRRALFAMLAAILVTVVVVGSVSAVDLCNFDKDIPKTRPNREAGPTEIRVGIFVFDLVDIITKNQEFILDFLLQAEWKDPRLGEVLRKSGRKICKTPIDDIWHPAMIPVNSRALRQELPRVLYVRANGSVEGRQRIIGTFAAQLDLTNFPRDTQTLPVTLISLEHGADELKFVFESGGGEEVFSEAGWSVERGRVESGAYILEALKAEGRDDVVALARFDYMIDVTRRANYYVWKVFVPLCLIVFTSWAAFWIDPTQLGVQTGIGTAMMLTIVAFLFSLQTILPKVPYLPRMDVFVFMSLAFVFLSFVESLTTCTMAARGNEVTARRVDRWSRVIFPMGFAIVIVNLWWL